MKVVPDIPKRRLGLRPRLAREHLTFATSKLAHHLRVPPTPSSALPPDSHHANPSCPAPRRQDGGRTLGVSDSLADRLKWRPLGRGRQAQGTLGGSARSAGNGAERGRAGASSGRGSC